MNLLSNVVDCDEMIVNGVRKSCSSSGTCVSGKRKCREIAESPSMMWKRSIVQAAVGNGRHSAAAQALALALVLSLLAGGCRGADLVIEIPGSGAGGAGAEDGGSYRLDYRPPQGSPAPNFTVPARASTINFQGLPGTKYHFMLYYSNGTFSDLLTWNQTIVTAPEPPADVAVTLARAGNKAATITWAPPAQGSYTGFRFRVTALTPGAAGGEGAQTLLADAAPPHALALRDLAPGATYQLHAFTLLHDKESAAYASRNFTTKPNTPGKFIVWFRNETTLLVLWQPPYPAGFYTHYKVSIVPPDARDSDLYVEKEGEPPGPAQAAFKGLMPGRAYNISVQTVSEPEISPPTTAQYRTVPLRPRNVTAPAHLLAETHLTLAWLPPAEPCEFDRYQVSVAGTGTGAGDSRRLPPATRPRADPPRMRIDNLEPGAHYTVTVKTMSGKVTSWPATAEVTLKPLAVRELAAEWGEGGALRVAWAAAPGSAQDEYRVWWEEAGDSGAVTVAAPAAGAALDALLPGRNYTVSVAAVSRGVQSAPRSLAAATRPLAPLLEAAAPADTELRLAWRSDVTSRQDRYRLRYARLEPGAPSPPSPGDYRALETEETRARLTGLFPGAVYEVRIAALSHGLAGEELVLARPVRPLPPRSLRVERASSTGATVTWTAPDRAASALAGFRVRYRAAAGDAPWSALPPLAADATRATLADLAPGERYLVELDSLSEAAGAAGAPGAPAESVASGAPLLAEHTVRPSPVSNVAQLVDTRNLTLEWPRAAGRVDKYQVVAKVHEDEREEGEGDEGGEGAALWAGAAPGAATVRLLVPALRPGTGYTLAITAISYNLTSDVFTLDTRTRPLIQSEMTIVPIADSEAGETEAEGETETGAEAEAEATERGPGFLVTFTATPAAATRFDAYRFRVERGAPEEGGPPEEPREATLARDAALRRVRFAPLVPGALYNVTMWTASRNASSHPVQRQWRVEPRPVGAVDATAVGARSVALAWPPPLGVYADFEVQYLAAADTLRTHVAREPRLTLHALRPHTLYTFTVVTRAGGEASLRALARGVSVAVTTPEAPPPPPRDFRPSDARPSRLTFVWSLPAEEANGVLRRFLLEYYPQNEPALVRTLEFPAAARSGDVGGLAPGGTYEFVLSGETGGGRGAGARWTQHMDIAPPPRPPPGAAPRATAASSTTVSVRFRGDLFSSANGNVTAYTVVVAEDARAAVDADAGGAGGGGGGRLPSWREVQALPRWPPYQATEPYFPFRAAAEEEFTVGAERCGAGSRAYCNGPLRPATTYYVKLRAFTAPDKYTDTEYVEVRTEADNTAWVAGGCVAALAALGAGAGALVARRRRRRAASAPAAPAPRASRPVRVADFVEHYRRMAADSDFRFSEEFEELKGVGRDQPCTAAELPVNRPKNRFTNVLPYDHSRFKLRPVDDEEGSDYINANYVAGVHSPREFIVTQGPLHSTRDDFWRMCWESGARAVVMLTRCVEKGREKCDRYWPFDTRPAYYGEVMVTALNESRYPDWTVTELGVARGGEQRALLHFHFTTWPDFGVPEPPTTLARFVRAFRERVPPDARPVVVHCSAGVGRSGTFVTLDAALAQLARGADHLDVFGTVHALRKDRVFMVQTEQQYICIHQCLVAVLEGQDLQPPRPHPLAHHHNPAYEDDEGIAESGM